MNSSKHLLVSSVLALLLAPSPPAAGAAEGGQNISTVFRVVLPVEKREFPEPLKQGQKPGFVLRGTKGWMWTPEQTLAEIPVLAKYKMNFFMNCYGSMWDIENHPRNAANINRWWEDLPPAKKQAYEEIVKLCEKSGVDFCFSINPGLNTTRPLDYTSEADLKLLWKHYQWMQGLGVKWFNISLDDITKGIDPAGQARAVNEIYRRLLANDPQARMIFCPTKYVGDGTAPEVRAYLEVLARDLQKDVYLFWTGNGVGGTITRQLAESYKKISGHRLILWDNYPVNDDHPTMHLGPITDRAADLGEVVDGYMSNPNCTQNEGNRIPLLTCADYAYNPSGYEPGRSVAQAIMHLESTPRARQLLAQLVENYPGFQLCQSDLVRFNPVRERFKRHMALADSGRSAQGYITQLERLAADLEKEFPGRYLAEKKTLAIDITFLKEQPPRK